MPNIEMYGFEKNSSSDLVERRIKKNMRKIGFGSTAVVTRVNSIVTSCDGQDKKMPFVRVCSTGGIEEINKIVEAFKKDKLKIDCEKFPLPPGGFIPAEEMQ